MYGTFTYIFANGIFDIISVMKMIRCIKILYGIVRILLISNKIKDIIIRVKPNVMIKLIKNPT